jgi:hypothetical protein
VANASIAPQIHESFDAHRRFPAQITFDLEFADLLAQRFDLRFAQLTH